MEDTEIMLGDTVKEKYTGFKGVCVAKTEFINRCVQFSVAPKFNSKGNPELMEMSIDEQSLVLIKKGDRHESCSILDKVINGVKEKFTGGASKPACRMRGW